MIRKSWFKTLPERAWQYWFWMRVDNIRRELRVKSNDLNRIKTIALEVDNNVKQNIRLLRRRNNNQI